MCGIAGSVDWSDPTVAPATDVGVMANALVHRGPDDYSVVQVGAATLGHCRLSILDPTPAGRQPMSTPDGRFWLVYNGEIYNFLELRSELERVGHQFLTETDSEVVLAAFAEWGPNCVSHFNGMWALGIWDAARSRLFLSRDRLGVKPLFLARSGHRLAFASEIKSLLTIPWVRGDLDITIVRDYLLDGVIDHTERTFFQFIKRLPASHSLVASDSSERLVRYWSPPRLAEDASLRPDAGDANRIDEVRALLIDSVALRLRSDVPLGSCLSGGLDSSSIVGIAAALRNGRFLAQPLTRREREQSPHRVFFAHFTGEGLDERTFVDDVVVATGTNLSSVTPTTEDFQRVIRQLLWHQDEPVVSTSLTAQYLVMQDARSAGVKVLLDGQGADELFAGYPSYGIVRAASALRSGDLRSGSRFLGSSLGQIARGLRYSITGTTTRSRLPSRVGPIGRAVKPLWGYLDDRVRREEPLMPELDPQPGTFLARFLWDQVRATHLPALLRYEDRNSMAFGIEARVPFLDYRLVEAALALPDRLRVNPPERKIALRAAVRDVVPSSVLGRRDKIAFQTPQQSWLMGSLQWLGPLAERSRAEELGFIQRGGLLRAVNDFAAGRLGNQPFWRLANLELWARDVVDQKPGAPPVP